MTDTEANKQHVATDPSDTWQRMENMVKKAVQTPRALVEHSIKIEQEQKIRRKKS